MEAVAVESLGQLLSGAGNLAMIWVAVGFWKLDKRLSHIEWWKAQISESRKG